MQQMARANQKCPMYTFWVFNLETPEKYTLTKDGKLAVLHALRLWLIRWLDFNFFSIIENIKLIVKCNYFFVDGTFKCFPRLFTQINTSCMYWQPNRWYSPRPTAIYVFF